MVALGIHDAIERNWRPMLHECLVIHLQDNLRVAQQSEANAIKHLRELHQIVVGDDETDALDAATDEAEREVQLTRAQREEAEQELAAVDPSFMR
jgi:hypothetical protein